MNNTGAGPSRQALPLVDALAPTLRNYVALPLPHLPHLALQAPAFPLRHAAPDTETLIVFQRVLQALGPDLATPADPLGLPGGAALLWEERLRICLRTQRTILPAQVISFLWTDDNVR